MMCHLLNPTHQLSHPKLAHPFKHPSIHPLTPPFLKASVAGPYFKEYHAFYFKTIDPTEVEQGIMHLIRQHPGNQGNIQVT